jgi:hypothetical protein
MKLLVLSLLLSLAAVAQEPTLRSLGATLQQALKQSANLGGERQVLAARLEIMKAQTEELLEGGGDLESLFRFYAATQAQAAAAPLPGPLQGSWSQVQALMGQLARETNRPAPPVAGPAYDDALTTEKLEQALHAAAGVEAEVGPVPPGLDRARYEEARRALRSLRADLQRALVQLKAGDKRPAAYAGVLRERRRWMVFGSALQLPVGRSLPLNEALERLPLLK